MTVIDLTARRLERLEKAQKQTNESLGHIAAILEVHTHQFERIEDAIVGMSDRMDRLSDRMDRLTAAIASGRTKDLVRFDKVERRLSALETRSRRKPKRR